MKIWCWHIHHNVLVEPLTGPLEERIAFIRQHKPKGEIALRLRLLHPVQGALPAPLVQALAAYDQARAAYDQAETAYKQEVEALHAQECPDCTWNGLTIFPKGEKP